MANANIRFFFFQNFFGFGFFFNICMNKADGSYCFRSPIRATNRYATPKIYTFWHLKKKNKQTIKRSGSYNNEAFVKCVRFHVNGLK